MVQVGPTTVSINGNQSTTVNVACPAGKVVMSGGVDFSGNGTVALLLVASYPTAADNWRSLIKLNQVSAATFTWKGFAVCAVAH